jgi:two-component system cell cycle sensor histidine kinase/response regulator CckA
LSNIRLSFRARIFILVSVLMIFSMSAISVFFLKNLKSNMSIEFRERGKLLAKEFSQKIAEGIVIEDKRILDKFISQLCESKDVLYVYIYNESGLRLAKKVLLGGIENDLPLKDKLNDMEIEELPSGDTNHPSVLDISSPVSYEDKSVGYTRLGISLKRIDDEVNKRLLNSSILVVVFIFVGLAICYFFSRSFSKPISQLLEGVKKIGHGDLSHHVKVHNKDEVGELAAAFNQMTDRLSESEDKLKKYALELEKKVEERTGELKQINEQLAQDITKRKKIEHALRESKERYQMLFNHLPVGAIHYDENGIILNLNNRFAEIMGAPREKLNGFDMLKLPHNEKMEKALQDSFGGKPGHFEDDYISVFSGERLFLKVICHGLTDEDGKFIGGVGLFEDNTDRKKSEEERMRLQAHLQRAQKMEAIGTLAGGVAHDLNNILSGLVTYPELILMDLAEDHPLRAPILTIRKSGQKAAAIVQDLLALARRGVAISEIVNLNGIISDLLRSPEYEATKRYHPNVQFELDIDQHLPNTTGSPVHLSKCIMNLISNAAEAIPDSGKVILSTTYNYLDKPVQGYDDIRKGEYVILSITDSGVGMSSEEISRIFEPFYTKKVMGRSGTGLGMSVVWNTIKDHNGYIDVQSSKGKGTRFDLYFPATDEKVDRSEVSVPLNEIMGKEKILVVDDVEEQRLIASSILKKLGYSVKALSSGEEAVEYLKKNSADLLILDMMMDPGIDGLETYKRIQKYHPHQKAIIASGYSETERVKEARRIGVNGYIQKPYSLEKIGLAVRTQLNVQAID